MDALLLAGYGSDSEEEDPVSSRAKRDRSIIPEAKVRPNVPLSTIVLGACGNSSSSSDDEMKDRNLTTRKRKNSPSFGETETKKREAFLTSDRLPPPLAQKLSTRNIDAKTRTFRDYRMGACVGQNILRRNQYFISRSFYSQQLTIFK